MIKILHKIKTTNWFWYLILFIIGSIVYNFQSYKYSSLLSVSFYDKFIFMLGTVLGLFIVQSIAVAVYNVMTKKLNLETYSIDMDMLTPLFIVISIFFLIFFFFPSELKTQALKQQLDKINTIASQDDSNMEDDLYKIQELSNLDELFPDTDSYDDSEY